MRPIYLLLITAAAFALCAFLLRFQASPATYVPAPAPESIGGIKIDEAIDATNVVHFDYVGTEKCLTPESQICWETQPEVVIQ